MCTVDSILKTKISIHFVLGLTVCSLLFHLSLVRDTSSILNSALASYHPKSPFCARQVPCGVNFKYNYFVREKRWPSCNVTWRPGPEFSLSVPATVKEDRKIMVRDSWTKFNTERSPDYLWGSWIEERYLPLEPSNCAPTRGNIHILAI